MSQHRRRITPDDILDAAERVATRLGAVGLSIEEVAREAGISKSHVVYDFKSKNGLLLALVERRLKIEATKVDKCVAEENGAKNPALFGRIKAASIPVPDADKSAMMAICTATSNNEDVQKLIRRSTLEDFAEIEKFEQEPLPATLAYLALFGLQCIEYFDFRHWNDKDRAAIIEGIARIYTTLSKAGDVSDFPAIRVL